MKKTVLIGAAVAGFAILNIAGLAVIANGSPIGSVASSMSGDPQVMSQDDRFTELSGGTAQPTSSPGRDGGISGANPTEMEPDTEGPEGNRPEHAGPPEDGPLGDGPIGGPGSDLKGSEEAWEFRSLLDQADTGIKDAEDVATGETPGQVIESKLEDHEDTAVYKVKVLGEDGNLYEYKVDTTGGGILESEIKDSRESQEASYLVENASLGRDEAEDQVLGEFGGDLVESKLSYKEGYVVYEIESLTQDGVLYETIVDARNGDVRGWKIEGEADLYRSSN